MRTVSAGLFCIAVSISTCAFACNPSMLRDSMDRLKAGPQPYAYDIARYCADILKDPNNVTSRAALLMDFKAGLAGKPLEASSIDGCSKEQIHDAC